MNKSLVDDVFEPDQNEFPELERATLLERELAVVTEATSRVQAKLVSGVGFSKAKRSDSSRKSLGNGPEKPGGVIPEYRRWRIQFSLDSIENYAKMLDHFKIQIGAIASSSNEIHLLTKLSGSLDVQLSSRKEQSRTLRFSHIKPTLRAWDEAFIRKAGLEPANVLFCQFYPSEMRRILRNAERLYLMEKGRKLDQVKKTTFEITESDSGFELTVLEIQYRQ